MAKKIDNTKHSKYKKFLTLTFLGFFLGGFLALIHGLPKAPNNHVFDLLIVFSLIGLRKIYPHSSWMTAWSFLCIFLTSLSLTYVNNQRIGNNIKASIVEAVQSETAHFSKAEHGKYADYLKFVFEKRKESNYRYERFFEKLVDLGWDSLGWDFILTIENWAKPDSWEGYIDSFFEIVELIDSSEIEFSNYLENTIIEMKHVIYNSLEKSEADKVWSVFYEKFALRKEQISRQMEILSEIAFLNIDLTFLMQDCVDEFQVVDGYIEFFNESNLEKYQNIFKNYISLMSEFERISDSVEKNEQEIIERLSS